VSDRDILTVIAAIYGEVPFYCIVLRDRLRAIRTSAMFAAPEAMFLHWASLSAALMESLPTPPVEDWQKRIDEIMRGKRGMEN
jgi:hypothetical protein